MSDRQNSLKPIAQRTPYAAFARPLRGNVTYRWNVLNAALVQGERDRDGVYPSAPFALDPDSPTILFMALFTQDVPVYLVGESRYPAGSYEGTALPAMDMVETDATLIDAFAATEMATVGAVEAGEVSRVRFPFSPAFPAVAAYAAIFGPVPRGIRDGEDELVPCTLRLSVIAESGVLAGAPDFSSVGQSGVVDAVPVYLPAGAYTQEIRDAENVIPAIDGGPVYVVVGLYDTVVVP